MAILSKVKAQKFKAKVKATKTIRSPEPTTFPLGELDSCTCGSTDHIEDHTIIPVLP